MMKVQTNRIFFRTRYTPTRFCFKNQLSCSVTLNSTPIVVLLLVLLVMLAGLLTMIFLVHVRIYLWIRTLHGSHYTPRSMRSQRFSLVMVEVLGFAPKFPIQRSWRLFPKHSAYSSVNLMRLSRHLKWRREWDSNPRSAFRRSSAFQAGALGQTMRPLQEWCSEQDSNLQCRSVRFTGGWVSQFPYRYKNGGRMSSRNPDLAVRSVFETVPVP